MKMSKVVFHLLILSVLLISCTSLDTKEIVKSMYNVPETGMSEFDGSEYIRMKNISCIKDHGLLLDLYQDSKMAKKKLVILTLKVTGYHSISDGRSLHFNIDGEIIDLKTFDATTEVEEVYPSIYQPGFIGSGIYIPSFYSPAVHASTKRYVITEALVIRIANANRVVMKADLARTYIEGVCSPQASDEWTKEKEWLKEYSGTYGFKTFAEMMKSLDTE